MINNYFCSLGSAQAPRGSGDLVVGVASTYVPLYMNNVFSSKFGSLFINDIFLWFSDMLWEIAFCIWVEPSLSDMHDKSDLARFSSIFNGAFYNFEDPSH